MRKQNHFLSCGGASIVIDADGNHDNAPKMLPIEKLLRKLGAKMRR